MLLMLALLNTGGAALLGASCGRSLVRHDGAPVRHGALRMQTLPTGGSDLEASNEQGNTFWATLDGRHADGISPDGVMPPGDDLIEDDLKRVFSIDPDENGMGGDSAFSDMDELQAATHSPPFHLSGRSVAAVFPHTARKPTHPPTAACPLTRPAPPALVAAHVQTAQGAGRE